MSLKVKPSDLLIRLTSTSGSGKSMEDAEEAVADEECPVCKHPKLSYRTAQTRGLDEGQTVFYTCMNPKCKHKFALNS
jgi:DNA-directed RNA polymerase I subunit RPA12